MKKFSGFLFVLLGVAGALACDTEKLSTIESCVPDSVKNFNKETGNVEEMCQALHESKPCIEGAMKGCEGDSKKEAEDKLMRILGDKKPLCSKCNMTLLENVEKCIPESVKDFDKETGDVDAMCKALHESKPCIEDHMKGCEGEPKKEAEEKLMRKLGDKKSLCPKPEGGKDGERGSSGSGTLKISFLYVLAFALLAKVFVF